MSVREKIGRGLASLGNRLAQQSTDPAGAGYMPADLVAARNRSRDRPIGYSIIPPASRQIWELRPAREESRQLALAQPHFRAFVKWAKVQVVGAGRSRLSFDRVKDRDRARLSDAIEWLRDQWIAFHRIPIGGRDETLPQLAGNALHHVLVDGDCFVLPYLDQGRQRFMFYAGDALAESAHLPMGGRRGRQRALGITTDRRGRPTVYHFADRGEYRVGAGITASQGDVRDVRASRVWHIRERGENGQTLRGWPWSVSVINLLGVLDQFDEAFIRAATRRAAIGLALIQDPELVATTAHREGVLTAAQEAAQQAAQPTKADGAREDWRLAYQRAVTEAGETFLFAPGYRPADIFPGTPSPQEGMLVERLEKRICGGLRCSLATLIGDYQGQNFSSSQQGTLQEKETVGDLQRLLVGGLYDPVYARFFLDRWDELLLRFPRVMPDDRTLLAHANIRLRQYVVLEKHRIIPAVLKAFIRGLYTWAEARDLLGETAADREAFFAEWKADMEALGIDLSKDDDEDDPPEKDDDEEGEK